MTDEQIVKALECCLSSNDLIACWKCPAVKLNICCDGSSKISNGIVNKVVDLIKRQQMEIDHLRKVTKKVKLDLKYYLDTNEENGVVWIPDFTVDNLVRVMTEKEGGNNGTEDKH